MSEFIGLRAHLHESRNENKPADELAQAFQNEQPMTAAHNGSAVASTFAGISKQPLNSESAANKNLPQLNIEPIHLDLEEARRLALKQVNPGNAAIAGWLTQKAAIPFQERILGSAPEISEFRPTANFAFISRTLDNRVLFGTAAIVGGLSTYALTKDVQNLLSARQVGSTAFYAVSSALDATALAGAAMSVSPGLRKYSFPLMSVGAVSRSILHMFE